MKYYFYINKSKTIEQLEWNELIILNKLLKNDITLPIINNYIDEKYINNLKKNISTLNDYIPLFNINIRDIQLVEKSLVYDKIILENYRFPDKYIINNIKNHLIKCKNKNLNDIQKKFCIKLKKTYKFLNYFDHDLLKQSYINIVYYGTNKIGKNLTTFERISYLPFLPKSKPYYTRSEIINMGLNFNLIKPSNKIYDFKLLKSLYDDIIKNDFSSKILIENLFYIDKTNSYNIIQFYTFHGSYYMNSYLRNTKNKIQDKFLELLIKKLWNIIIYAPKLKKEKLVYRFIDDDYFISHLKINDIYQDKGFLSTTRNQFYDIDSNKFGYILLKIIIPDNSLGCLCVESCSLFTDEEEVILSPTCSLKLINKDYNVNYFHIKDSSDKKITKKYEFLYLGPNKNIKLDKKNKEEIPEVDLYKFDINGKNLSDKIDFFIIILIKLIIIINFIY